MRDELDVGQDEDLDHFRAKFLQSGHGSVVGDQGPVVVLQGVGEHPGHARLDVVGRGVEVLADVRHEPGRKTTEGPMIVHLIKEKI